MKTFKRASVAFKRSSVQACKQLLSATLLVALAISPSACKSLRRGGPPIKPITMEVTNHGFADVAIYVQVTGNAMRIGNVSSNTSSQFTLNSSHLPGGFGSLQLIARPLAGRSYYLPSVSVSPGDFVTVVIENAPSQAQVTVQPAEPPE